MFRLWGRKFIRWAHPAPAENPRPEKPGKRRAAAEIFLNKRNYTARFTIEPVRLCVRCVLGFPSALYVVGCWMCDIGWDESKRRFRMNNIS